MEKNTKCPFCCSIAKADPNYNDDTVFWDCPTCGRFKLSAYSATELFLKSNVKDIVATYLFYNGVHKKRTELHKSNCRYIWLDDESHKSDDSLFEDVAIEQIMAFYDIDFTEKISLILLDVAKRTRFFSEHVEYSFNQLLSLAFCKRWDNDNTYNESSLINQALFILNYLKENNWIDYEFHNPDTNCKIKMLSSGWARVENTERDDVKRRMFLLLCHLIRL